MIYFALAVSVLGQAVQNGAVLELTGEAAKVEFGGALTLIHNSTEDELVCSGKIRASDVVIKGTTTTVAQMLAEHATMKDDIAALKQFVGMLPPPPPPLPPTFSYVGSCGECVGTSGERMQFCHTAAGIPISRSGCQDTCTGIAACVAYAHRSTNECLIHFDAGFLSGFLSHTSDCSTLGEGLATRSDWMSFSGTAPAVSGFRPATTDCLWSCYAKDE